MDLEEGHRENTESEINEKTQVRHGNSTGNRKG